MDLDLDGCLLEGNKGRFGERGDVEMKRKEDDEMKNRAVNGSNLIMIE